MGARESTPRFGVQPLFRHWVPTEDGRAHLCPVLFDVLRRRKRLRKNEDTRDAAQEGVPWQLVAAHKRHDANTLHDGHGALLRSLEARMPRGTVNSGGHALVWLSAVCAVASSTSDWMLRCAHRQAILTLCPSCRLHPCISMRKRVLFAWKRMSPYRISVDLFRVVAFN